MSMRLHRLMEFRAWRLSEVIRIRTDENTWVEVKGHAGYAEPGKDIVCAAVSALYETLRLALGEICGVENPEVEPGLIRLSPSDLSPLARAFSSASTLFEAFTMGMREIALQYPDYVSYEVV